MNRSLRLSYLASILLACCGLILHLALQKESYKYMTYQEAYLRILKEGIRLTPSFHNFLSIVAFLMVVTGLAGLGFTIALAVRSKAPYLGKIIQIMVVGSAVLYFGATLYFMVY